MVKDISHLLSYTQPNAIKTVCKHYTIIPQQMGVRFEITRAASRVPVHDRLLKPARHPITALCFEPQTNADALRLRLRLRNQNQGQA